MNSGSNNLSKHFGSFLPELEPGEIDAVWRQVEPHLPVRKRRRLLWLPMTAGMVAVISLAIALWPSAGPVNDKQVLTNTSQSIKADNKGKPAQLQPQAPAQKYVGRSKAPEASAAATAPIEKNRLASREKPPSVRPRRSAEVAGRNQVPYQQNELPFSRAKNEEPSAKDAYPGKTVVIYDSLPVSQPESGISAEILPPNSLPLPLTTAEKAITPEIGPIARPQVWSSRATLIIFGGAALRNTLYSSQSKHLQPGWNAGLSFNRLIGKRWLLHATAQVGGLIGSYSERAEYYETLYPPVQSAVSGTSPAAGTVRYRLVTDESTVTSKSGYLLSAGAGFCVWSGYRVNVNFLASFGIQKIGYSGSVRRTFGNDTLVHPPAGQPMPQPPSYALAYASSVTGDTRNTSYRQYFIAPQLDIFYRLDHRFALVSRLTFVSPLSFGENLKRSGDVSLSSGVPAYSGPFQPVRSSEMMLNVGVSCKL